MINLAAFLGLILLMAGITLHAETTTWDGTDGDWSNGAKWNNGVPEANDDVVVNSGTLTLSSAPPALTSYTQGGGTLSFTNWTTKLEATTITLNAGTVTRARRRWPSLASRN